MLTSLEETLIKVGAKVVSHGRYIAFQMAEVAIPPTSCGSPDDDGPGLPTAAHGSNMSPERRIIR